MTVYLLGQALTEEEAQVVLLEFYALSKRIAKEVTNCRLLEPEKEKIAIETCNRALVTFDFGKGKSFTNYLKEEISSDIKKVVPVRSISAADVNYLFGKDIQRFKDFFQRLGHYKGTQFYHDILECLLARFDDRQKLILEMYLCPTIYIRKYNRECSQHESKLNNRIFSRFLRIEISRVSQVMTQMKDIALSLRQIYS